MFHRIWVFVQMSVKPSKSKSTDVGTEETLNVQTEKFNIDEQKEKKKEI